MCSPQNKFCLQVSVICGVAALWKLGHFELKTDFTDEAHRGYTGCGYNRDRLQWNASATWKCLHGRGRLTFSARDILGQSATDYAVVSANGREEYRWEYFHQYIALSFSYRLEPKGNKQGRTSSSVSR